MILSKITVHGFKSFAKKTELLFDGRITAVVGPNGCGKTNIVDAIRWGLGEQRPSVLRADRMDSVIFGGAQSSRPLGMAEVSIYFDNSKHILPIDYNEVVITRRLYRSGESEYLLNKSSVRLKDIEDLVMDTGIAADAYSVIELKMVEDILSEKTEDRRKLLEEAAGVTKYKHRLKAAMRKLESTQNDLLRVNDIIQEVERTVRSLKRQVQRAEQYQTVHDEIKEQELDRGSRLFHQLGGKIHSLKKELDLMQQEKDGRTTTISKEEADLESFRLQITEREKALVAAQEELSSVVERIHRREGDLRVGEERITSLEDRKTRNAQEIEILKKRLDEQKNHLEVAHREREALQVKITSSGRIFENKKKELEVFQQGLNFKRLELNKKKKEIIGCLEEVNRLSGEETRFRAKLDNNRGRLERLDEEDHAHQTARKRVQQTQHTLDETFRKLKTKQHEIVSAKERIVKEEERLRKNIESTKEQFFRDQGEADLLQGRLAFLKDVVESRGGVSDGAKKLIDQKAEGLLGIMGDLLETAPVHRRAIEVGLGEAARYLLFTNLSAASKALKNLKNTGGGRVTLVGLDRIKALPEQKGNPKTPEETGVVGWGNELVKCDSSIRPAVKYLLGDLLVVNDLDSAEKAVGTVRQNPIRVATLEGELITDWGSIQSGEPSDSDVGILGRRQHMEELKDQIQLLRKKITEVEGYLAKNEARQRVILQEKEKLEKELTGIEDNIMQEEKQRAKLQFEGEQAEEGIRKNGDERGKLLEEIEKGKESMENLRPQIERLLDQREQLDLDSSQMQNEVERLEEEEKVMEEEVHRLNLTVVRLNGEVQNLDYDVERSQKLILEISGTIDQRSKEIVEAKEMIIQYQDETAQNKKILGSDFENKEQVETQRLERENEYQTLREHFQTKEKEIRQVRRDREETAEKIHQLGMEISELEHQAKTLKDRILESYQADVATWSVAGEIDLEETEKKIEELKKKLKAIGPVNLVALQEYEEEKKRADFLLQQRDDLISAEVTLKETIQKINQTARNRFGEVFTEVRNNFKETFKNFFLGGEADLRLAEGEDPLEARIEIFARPAGKQLRDLDLLSGGEKALTAISLLFALYMVKPSPFCILDEIDAPLDDTNIERFTRVLSEYAEKTQFIIVTHNKMTMKVAQALYGVTMQEEGVSKIVSVKFGEEQKVNA